jgi:hypothetical protein
MNVKSGTPIRPLNYNSVIMQSIENKRLHDIASEIRTRLQKVIEQL